TKQASDHRRIFRSLFERGDDLAVRDALPHGPQDTADAPHLVELAMNQSKRLGRLPARTPVGVLGPAGWRPEEKRWRLIRAIDLRHERIPSMNGAVRMKAAEQRGVDHRISGDVLRRRHALVQAGVAEAHVR